MAKDTNIEQLITKAAKAAGEEARKQTEVLVESLRDDIKAVAEGVEMNSQRLDRLESMEATLEAVKGDVEVMKVNLTIVKTDVEFIKHELKRKVDYDEFAALEQRVSALETKSSD